MAVDRGGLNYTIRLRDEFTKTAANFRRQLEASKAAFGEFQKAAQGQKSTAASFRGTKKEIDENTKALKALAAESKRQRALEQDAVRIRNTQGRDASAQRRRQLAEEKRLAAEQARLLKEEQKRLKEFVDAQNRRQKIAEALENARRKDEAARNKAEDKAERQRQSRDPDFQAQKRINRGLFEEATTLRQIAQLRTRARAQLASGDLFGGSQSLKQARELERQVKGIDKASNNLLFTFRRLVGVLAVFTLAREVVQGFKDLVTAGVLFDDRIRSATIGIAGLVSSVADIRDEFGNSVDASQELVLAQQAARAQIRLLRQDVLRTTSSFEQLLDTFQIAVAPGFVAGLDLDEIRKLTVAISQAATAIGLPQNQLAEEIRSLLSGTIQARTTRIATALGITNADIKRLRETGELFDFLIERFNALGLAAQRAARQTLEGIRGLITTAVGSILGEAAEPLFQELLKLGNELFDEVLTLQDEAGNIRPNPEAVSAFKTLFEALTEGVRRLRSLALDFGFDGLQKSIEAFSTTLLAAMEFAFGFAKGMLTIFTAVVGVVKTIAETFGLTARDVGSLAGKAGGLLAVLFSIKAVLGAIGLDFSLISGLAIKIVRDLKLLQVGVLPGIAAALAGVFFGFNQIAEAIFGVELGIKDTISLISSGMAGAFVTVAEFAQVAFERITAFIGRIVSQLVQKIVDSALAAKEFILKNVGEDAAAQAVADQRFNREQAAEKELAKQRKQSEEEISAIRERATQLQLALEKQIADLVGKKAGEQAGGAAFKQPADPKSFAAAADSAGAFNGVLSTAAKEVQALDEHLVKLDEELRRTAVEFARASETGGLEGESSRIESFFTANEIDNIEKLRQIKSSLADVESKIAQIRSVSEAATAGQLAQLNSLLQDQQLLQNAILNVEQESAAVAVRKAAILAAEVTPGLEFENRLRAQSAEAEQRTADAVTRSLGARRLATIAAEEAVKAARLELDISKEKQQLNIQAVRLRRNQATGDERAALDGLLSQLERRLALETQIGDAQIKQLENERRLKALRETGTLGQGVREGFVQLADELPTIFEVGLNLTKQVVTDFSQFAAQSITQAIVSGISGGTFDFEQAAGQFLQGIAQSILEQTIQSLIQSQIQGIIGKQTEATIEITTANTVAGIKIAAANTIAGINIASAQTIATILAASGGVGAGLAEGGTVGLRRGGSVPNWAPASLAHYGKRAQGLRRGGRPKGLDPRDTVPIWAQPGEFMIRKPVVDRLGVDFFQAVNAGRMPVPSTDRGVAPDVGGGLAKGGLVTDATARVASRSSQEDFVVLPAVVAGEREMDTLSRGGRNAQLRFFRENAGSIRGALGIGR